MDQGLDMSSWRLTADDLEEKSLPWSEATEEQQRWVKRDLGRLDPAKAKEKLPGRKDAGGENYTCLIRLVARRRYMWDIQGQSCDLCREQHRPYIIMIGSKYYILA